MRVFVSITAASVALATAACGSVESSPAQEVTSDASGRRVFTLSDGEFVTYPPGTAQRGDKVVCIVDGKRITAPVPRRGVAVSIDPMVVFAKPNGEVRAECGGIHAETAPPGSW